MTTETTATSSKHSYVLASIPLDQITREEQVRKDWRHDEGVEKMDGLTESIRQHGILQPFLVKHNGDKGGYRLIAGHRRDVAALRAGEDTAPCIVWDGPDEDILIVQLIENLQRQDLSFIDRATAMQQLTKQYQISGRQLAKILGVSAPTVNGTLAIFEDDVLRDAVRHAQITQDMARRVLALRYDYRASIDASLRSGRKVGKAEVASAHRRQLEDGIVLDLWADRRGHQAKTVEQMNKVAELRGQGESFQDIVQELGLSEGAARRRLTWLNRSTAPSNTKDSNVTLNGVSLDAFIADAAAPPPAHPRPTHSPIPWENDPAEKDLPPSPDPQSQPRDKRVARTEDAGEGAVITALPDYIIDKIQWPEERTTNAARSPLFQQTASPTTGLTPPSTPAPYVVTSATETLADVTVLLQNHVDAVVKMLTWATKKQMTAAQLRDEFKALYGR